MDIDTSTKMSQDPEDSIVVTSSIKLPPMPAVRPPKISPSQVENTSQKVDLNLSEPMTKVVVPTMEVMPARTLQSSPVVSTPAAENALPMTIYNGASPIPPGVYTLQCSQPASQSVKKEVLQPARFNFKPAAEKPVPFNGKRAADVKSEPMKSKIPKLAIIQGDTNKTPSTVSDPGMTFEDELDALFPEFAATIHDLFMRHKTPIDAYNAYRRVVVLHQKLLKE